MRERDRDERIPSVAVPTCGTSRRCRADGDAAVVADRPPDGFAAWAVARSRGLGESPPVSSLCSKFEYLSYRHGISSERCRSSSHVESARNGNNLREMFLGRANRLLESILSDSFKREFGARAKSGVSFKDSF